MTKRKRISRIVNGILLGICILSAAAALLLGGETVKEGWEYDSLAKDAEVQTADGIDWSMLRGRNQDIAAWLRVEGTTIDLPVVNTRKGDPADFYLRHDFDRNPSFDGCPIPGRKVYGRRCARTRIRTPPWGLPVRSSPLFSRPIGKRNSTRSARCIGSLSIKDGRCSSRSWRCQSTRNTSQSRRSISLPQRKYGRGFRI